jgi:hypothetical protein
MKKFENIDGDTFGPVYENSRKSMGTPWAQNMKSSINRWNALGHRNTNFGFHNNFRNTG